MHHVGGGKKNKMNFGANFGNPMPRQRLVTCMEIARRRASQTLFDGQTLAVELAMKTWRKRA